MYEHGRVGSCLSIELSHMHRSHCFHAHMVFLPESVDILYDIQPYFDETNSLSSLLDITKYERHYIYYEYIDGSVKRYIFKNPKTMYSQFMRKNICRHLNLYERWDWAEVPNWELVHETVVLLRPVLANLITSFDDEGSNEIR